MSNALTGDYDVVVEVGIETMNRLLATLHQKGVSEQASPKFLHSLTARVGSMPKRVEFELAEAVLGEYFGNVFDSGKATEDVLSNVQNDAAAAQAALTKLERNLSGVVESTAAGGTLAEAINNVGAAVSIVRGTAKIQVGALTVTLSGGSTTEVTVHAHVRVHYAPDPGTAGLPAPIHGEVRASFTAAYNPSGSAGKPAIEVKPSDDNNKITFIPAAGTLTDPEAKLIAHQVRRFLRTKFKPMSAELPDDFPFKGFKSLIKGAKQAIALPLEGEQGSELDSLSNFFLGAGDDFALAISRDFIDERFASALSFITQFSRTFRHHQEIFGVDTIPVGFHVWVSTASLGWEQGGIRLTVSGGAHVWGWLVPDDDYTFTIEQRFKLELDVPSQTISLTPDGDPSISGLPKQAKDEAKSAIAKYAMPALHDAQKDIREALKQLSSSFNDALKPFDPAAHAKFTALEVGPDGVTLRGSVSLSSRPAVVVDVRETAGGKALTAFKSWIPAGTVENYEWSWVTGDPYHLYPWGGGHLHVLPTPHSFIFYPPIQSGPGKQPRVDLQRVCLTVEGTQIGKGAISGQDQTSCSFNTPDWMVATLPAWWVNIMLPVWGPDPGPEGILADHIIAHISVPSRVAPSAETGTAAIVHFAGDSSMVPLPVLGEALLASRLRDAEVPVIVVLPRGSFGQPKARVEARLGLFPRELSTPLAVTEDYEGGWTNAFKAPAGPITYFMSASGDLPWQEAGAPRAQALTAALDQHGSAGRRGRATLMRLRVRPGDPAPDLFIEDESPRQRRADRMLPPRLCGQRTLLLFWKSWSRPCLTELRRLQQVNSETSGEGPVIVAVGDGEPPERVRTIAQEHGLGFRLLPDPTSQLARRYRVACWPTAVWIDEQAFIERVHFGVTPDRSRTA